MNRQVTLSTTNKRLAGVCGAIAEYLNVDPVIVRIVFIALTLATGVGFWLYLGLWLALRYPRGQAAVTTVLDMGRQAANQLQGVIATRPRFDPQTGAPIAVRTQATTGVVLMGLGTLILASTLHLTGPLIALAFVAGGWYLIKR